MSTIPALYELADQYTSILDMDLPAEQVQDTLDLIEADIKEKSQSIGFVLQSFDAQELALTQHLETIAAKLKAIKAKRDNLKAYLKYNMEATGISKIDCPYFSIALQPNPPSVDISDEALIPGIYKQQVVTVKIDKKTILNDLKAGSDIPGCTLARGTHVRIR